MTDPLDVRLLQSQDLPRDEFPGARGEDFRVYFAPEVHDEIARHAAEDTTVEICGVLVGTWRRDEAGPLVRITAAIRGESAQSKFAEVTFTHETWARINARMDAEYADRAIVGWYHTHPDFGVFLSDRDRFIQEHFFSGPGQVAYVLDPVRKTEGVFVWRDGKPTLADHFWVGPQVRVGTAAGAEARPASATVPAEEVPTANPPARSPGRSGSVLGRLLVALALLIVGYWAGQFNSAWQRRLLAEGAVAHFGIWKGLRPGLRQELDALTRDLDVIAEATRDLEARTSRRDDKGPTPRDRVTWDELRAGLRNIARRAERLKTEYGFTDAEDDAVRYLLARIEALTDERVGRATEEEKAAPEAKVKEGEKPPTETPEGKK